LVAGRALAFCNSSSNCTTNCFRTTGSSGSVAGSGRSGALEGATLQPLAPQRDSVGVPVEQFHQIAALVDEHEQPAAQRILPQVLDHQGPITMPIQPASNCRAWCHAQIACA
jgi:hypothetical protein